MNWIPMTGNDPFVLVTLPPTDSDYQDVLNNFQKTCSREIVKVH